MSYTCPMHPEIRKDSPGMCPECGMQLVPSSDAKKHAGHDAKKYLDKHAGHSTASFGRKFWVSLALTIPVLLYSHLVQQVLNFSPPMFPGSNYLPLGLSTIVFFYGGLIFIRGAIRELAAKLPGMMTLIALAIATAYLFSIYAVVSGSGEELFFELTTLITVMLFGHWMEMRAVGRTQGALQELSKLLPDEAEVVVGDTTKRISINELKKGDLLLVRPGGRIPADGVIKDGGSELNEAAITGESKPVNKKVGDAVIAGTTNGSGLLKIEVTGIGEHTFLRGVMRLVEEAQASKSRLQMLSDRAAYYLTIIAVATGVGTFIAWQALGDQGFGFAVERLVAVLVISCPHALGMAIPLVASISTTISAKKGILVKQRLALESARNIELVLFDKTGTLTTGEYGVDKVWPVEGDEGDVLRLAASVDSGSEHLIAQAVVRSAKEQKIEISEPQEFKAIPGKGASATISGKKLYIGGSGLLDDLKLSMPEKLAREIKLARGEGKTVIFLAEEGKVHGAISLTDRIRAESKKAVEELTEMGIKTGMITGDSDEVARYVANQLGLEEYFARVLPQEKSAKLKSIQDKGIKVAFVGDGINDAPALAQADVGIAIGAGTNVAIESAGIILIKSNPEDIPDLIRLSRKTYNKMIQNLFWATGYNVVAIPLAAGILASKGVLLEPALGALFMSLSTVIVAVNSLLLKGKLSHG